LSFKRGKPAIVSFPGVHGYGWNRLTARPSGWAQSTICFPTSCVFLPDEKAPGYGEHDDQEGQGCSCLKLYGQQEEWGCRWFTLWKDRTLMANDKRCNLWVVTKMDGSLGRSQEGEVDFLEEKQMFYSCITIEQFAKEVLAHDTAENSEFEAFQNDLRLKALHWQLVEETAIGCNPCRD